MRVWIEDDELLLYPKVRVDTPDDYWEYENTGTLSMEVDAGGTLVLEDDGAYVGFWTAGQWLSCAAVPGD